MLLDDVVDLLLLEVFELIFFQPKKKFGSTTQLPVNGVRRNGESTPRSRFPNVLFVTVVLGDDLNTFSDEVGRVEAPTAS